VASSGWWLTRVSAVADAPSPSSDDVIRKYLEQLYLRVGAVVVTGGHVEFTMMRLLTVLALASPYTHLDVDWDTAEKKLRQWTEEDPQDARRHRLAELLDWATRKKLRDRRNHAIHGVWWTQPNSGVARSRFRRRQSPVTIFGSFEALESDAQRLWEYAQRLSELVDDWVIRARSSGRPRVTTAGTPLARPARNFRSHH
jgi:hypothetical protein